MHPGKSKQHKIGLTIQWTFTPYIEQAMCQPISLEGRWLWETVPTKNSCVQSKAAWFDSSCQYCSGPS